MRKIFVLLFSVMLCVPAFCQYEKEYQELTADSVFMGFIKKVDYEKASEYLFSWANNPKTVYRQMIAGAVEFNAFNSEGKAEDYFEEALFMCHNDSLKALVYNVMGQCKKDPDVALRYYKLALEHRAASDGEFNEFTKNVCVEIAKIYHAKENFAMACDYYKKALMISNAVHGEESTNSAYLKIDVATMLYCIKDDKQATVLLDQALPIVSKNEASNGFGKGLAGIYWLKGDICLRSYDSDKALDFYQKAAAIFEKNPYAKLQTFAVYDDIGRLYVNGTSEDRMDKALEYYEKALKGRMEYYYYDRGENQDVAKSYYNVGRVYRYKHNYNKALENLNKSMLIWKKLSSLENSVGRADVHFELGHIYWSQKLLSMAIENFEMAYDLYPGTHFNSSTARNYVNNLKKQLSH